MSSLNVINAKHVANTKVTQMILPRNALNKQAGVRHGLGLAELKLTNDSPTNRDVPSNPAPKLASGILAEARSRDRLCQRWSYPLALRSPESFEEGNAIVDVHCVIVCGLKKKSWRRFGSGLKLIREEADLFRCGRFTKKCAY
jgi:hypothetical protein